MGIAMRAYVHVYAYTQRRHFTWKCITQYVAHRGLLVCVCVRLCIIHDSVPVSKEFLLTHNQPARNSYDHLTII